MIDHIHDLAQGPMFGSLSTHEPVTPDFPEYPPIGSGLYPMTFQLFLKQKLLQ